MNAAEAQDVKHLLLHSNDHYRQLVEQHHQLDHRLHELSGKYYLSSTEQLEEATIKKRKLALKDQMEAIAREYANGRSS
ncbi:MAG: YdcH family protein [Acidobacteria bacterium]|nr:YdcH family protein [Acidobacteriota bacterium]